jgi:hypothetical protein
VYDYFEGILNKEKTKEVFIQFLNASGSKDSFEKFFNDIDKIPETNNSISETVEPKLKNNSSNRIDGRAIYIGAQIYIDLHNLKKKHIGVLISENEFKNFVDQFFGIKQVSGNFKEFKKYNYIEVLDGGSEAEKAPLFKQLHQIEDHPEIFSPLVCNYVAQLIRKYKS